MDRRGGAPAGRGSRRTGAGAPRGRALNRGEIYDVEWPGAGRHPAVVVTRQVAIPLLTNVAVVLITSTVRGIRTEVPLGAENGVDEGCVASCDNILTISKRAFRDLRGHLGPREIIRLNDALRVTLELD